MNEEDLAGLPGAELVIPGLKQVHQAEVGECGLLVLIASPRLRSLGLRVPDRPDIPPPHEHRLYELLEESHGEAAYTRYNALLRRLASFIHALQQRISQAAS